MAYATTTDVLAPFPRFQTGLPNNISNSSIQGWLDEGKAVIRARFLRRSLDPDNPATLGWTPPLTELTTDQANVLRMFNAAYGIAKFGQASYSQLSKGEVAVVTQAWKTWEAMSKDTDASGMGLQAASRYILGNDGVFDALFSPNAAHVEIGPMFGGIAGADFDPRYVNNCTMGTYFMFQKGMKF